MWGDKMYLLKDLLIKTIESNASDLHLTVGIPPTIRVNGKLVPVGSEKLDNNRLQDFAKEILGRKFDDYREIGEYDLSYEITNVGRFRVNVFRQKGNDAIALRVITLNVPTLDGLKHPRLFKEMIKKRRGLILVTGPTGSGKSTTLAAMINEINQTRDCHIVTLEDPIEYVHTHNKSIINQREIGQDTESYGNALRAALREDSFLPLQSEA